MPRKAAPMVVALLALAAALGCGESSPKRAVDAQTEVLRFFAVDAPVVALVRPDPPARVSELNQVASGVEPWTRLRAELLGPLRSAGLGPRQLAHLVRPKEEIEGIPASALAFGAATPGSLASRRALLVLATDQSALLARLLRGAADRGQLRHAGNLDEAALYRRPGAAFAVRDGVLVSATRLGDVRAALQRRDGDSDRQLDEDVVRSLFDDLRIEGSLLVYADIAGVRDADPRLRALADRVPWIGELGQVAASARPVAGELEVEIAARSSEGDFAASGLPVDEAPTSFRVSAAEAAALLPGGAGDPAGELLSGIAPLSGKATASSDEVRAEAVVSP